MKNEILSNRPTDSAAHPADIERTPAKSGGPAHWIRIFVGLPLALLVPGLCPACWPVYVGLLSALGLGFVLQAWILLPLTLLALVTALASLAWKAPQRRGYWPLFLGLAAAAVLLTGWFWINSDEWRYIGVAMLFIACVWNGWPQGTGQACPNCRSTDGAGHNPPRVNSRKNVRIKKSKGSP